MISALCTVKLLTDLDWDPDRTLLSIWPVRVCVFPKPKSFYFIHKWIVTHILSPSWSALGLTRTFQLFLSPAHQSQLSYPRPLGLNFKQMLAIITNVYFLVVFRLPELIRFTWLHLSELKSLSPWPHKYYFPC